MIRFSMMIALLFCILGATPHHQLRQCPDAWYQNQMPTVTNEKADHLPAKEYFVIKGHRRELKEFDLNWVKENCKIKPTTVY